MIFVKGRSLDFGFSSMSCWRESAVQKFRDIFIKEYLFSMVLGTYCKEIVVDNSNS